MTNWDCNKNEFVETPSNILLFLNEINKVCKKYNLSISHEDGHGAFEIEKYSEDNWHWLGNANLNIKE